MLVILSSTSASPVAWHQALRTAGQAHFQPFRRVFLTREFRRRIQMFCASPTLFPSRIRRIAVVLSGALVVLVFAPVTLRAQRTRTPLNPEGENQPAVSDFKGVRIGMLADEARKKLGAP